MTLLLRHVSKFIEISLTSGISIHRQPNFLFHILCKLTIKLTWKSRIIESLCEADVYHNFLFTEMDFQSGLPCKGTLGNPERYPEQTDSQTILLNEEQSQGINRKQGMLESSALVSVVIELAFGVLITKSSTAC